MSLVDEDNQTDVDEDDLVAPPVVAVVVTHDPGPWFDEALAGLADQDYPALSVLVIDAGSSTDPTDRVAAALPDAHVRLLGANPGFGAAANEVLSLVEGSAFYLLCHDDVALAPDAIGQLVAEAYRSNAGIVGPKLVMWDDPRRLLQVGVSVDKSGHEVSTVERGELDQEQHDAVRDVFCIPGAATLVRSDLFATLGGFDPAISYLGEDLDLCWRAQVAGARVLVVPSAVARHLESLGQRPGFEPHDRRRLALRHRLRAVLTNYSTLHRVLVVPQVALLALAEVVYASLAGRRRLARAVIDSWRWNRSPASGVKAARARVAAIRSVPDSEVRRLQSGGSARFTLFVRGQLGRGRDDRVKAFTRSAGEVAGALRQGPQRTSIAVWATLITVVLVGSRHHLRGTPLSLVDLPPLPGRPWDLLAEWLSGWRRAGLGSEAPQPTVFGLLGATGTVLAGSTALLRRLLVLLPLLLGPIGAARILRASGSRRAPWVAAVTYAAIPLPYDALAQGRWGGLVVWSAVPWWIGALLRAGGQAPYPPQHPESERGSPPSARRRSALSLGLLTAVITAVLPIAAVAPLVLVLVLVAGAAIGGSFGGARRMVTTGAGASLVALGLNLPWTLDLVLPGSTWAGIAGAETATAAPGLGELLRFQTGPIGAAPIGWVFLVVALLPLLVGRAWRLRMAVQAWVLAAAGWALAVASGLSAMPVSLGPPELALAPAACGLAVAAALGMAAFEIDVPDFRFGWRQVASIVAAVALSIGTIPVITGALDGDWGTPDDGVASVLGFLDSEQETEGPFRTLWIGDPSVLPMQGWELGDGMAWGLTDRGLPDVLDRWTGSPEGSTGAVSEVLELATSRQTARLGRLLAPMGVRYVVVVEADRPIVGPQTAAPAQLVAALGEQLDLAELGVDAGLRVFRNAAWFPSRAVLADGTDTGTELGALATAGEDVAAAPALTGFDGVQRFTGDLRAGDVVWQATSSSSGWSLAAGGEGRDREEGFGFGNVYAAGEGGAATLEYSTPILRLVLSGFQAAAWVLVIRALWRARREQRAAEELTADATVGAEPEPEPAP